MNKISLGDPSIYISDGNYSSKYPRANEMLKQGIPFITPGNFKGDIIDRTEINYISSEKHSILKKGHIKENDILITVRGNNGKVMMVSKEFEDANINAQLAFIRTDNTRLYSKYIYYYLLSNQAQNYVKSNETGSALKQFPICKLIRMEIPEYTLEEQTNIIFELDNINKSLKCKNKELSFLDELIKSRFIEMFGDPIQNEKAWGILRLNEITDVRDGTHDSPKYHDIGYPFVTSKNLVNGKIDFSTCQLISKEDYLHFNDRSRVDDGDILMPMIGTIGGAIIVKKDREFSIKNVALIKFTKNNFKIDRTFILYVLNSNSMSNYFELTKKGGTQKFIALGLIRNIPIIVPPIELQNEFANFVEQIDKSKFIVQQQIKDLQELLDKKMDEYFSE